MASYAFFIKTVTALINERIGKDGVKKTVTADEVEKVFGFKEMDQGTLLRLSKNLADETRTSHAFELKLLDDETDTIQRMVDLGLISFEWREEREEKNEEQNEDDEDKENIRQPIVNEEEVNSDTSSLFSAAFLKCARSPFSDTANNNKVFKKKMTECSELFVVFDIDRMSMYKEFVELKIMPLVAHYVIRGLNLNCTLESMPVKPCRRKASNEVWCQLMANYENTNVTKRVLDFAEKSPLARSKRADNPRRIKVYFSLDDAVDMDNPWGSCPLLHNGTNFRIPEFSRCFNEFTDSKVDCDTAENSCFIYSQKNPTIEIPSKLNTEAEIVMRGAVSDAKYLFGEEEEEEEEKGMNNKNLVIAMAFSHPKSRIRNIGNFYFSVHLPQSTSILEKTWKCPFAHSITVGRDAIIVPPSKKAVAVEEKKEYDEERTKQELKNSMSRKMSVSSYRCLACRGASNKCSERDKFCRPPVASSSSSSSFSVLARMEQHQCNSLNHLSHGSGPQMIDILLNCTKNGVCKRLAHAIVQNSASSKFTTKICDRGAVCHNFFCKGVQPVCTPFSSKVIKKNKLILYGKMLDVVNTNYSASVPINRRRIFYTNKELNNNDVPIRSEEAKTAFKDIVYHECNKTQIELHGRKNNVTASSTSNNKKWWKTLVDLTADFDRRVEQFYTDLANLQDNSKLFKTLFSEFNEKCKKYSQAKSELVNSQKDEEEDVKKDERKEIKEVKEIVNVLAEYHARDDAATSALMHKSMFLGSRTVFSGARCVVSEENRKFEVRQYVVTMAGSAVTKVTDEDLVEYTPVKGAVSVTTAPNDKLPAGAYQTWQDFESDAGNIKSPSKCNGYTSSLIKYDNFWRIKERPSCASSNRSSFPTTTDKKYIIPPRRN